MVWKGSKSLGAFNADTITTIAYPITFRTKTFFTSGSYNTNCTYNLANVTLSNASLNANNTDNAGTTASHCDILVYGY